MMNKYEKVTNQALEYVKEYATRDNFTEEELGNYTLDGFDKLTSSRRILRLVKLAYYRGMGRGIKIINEMGAEITLR